MAHELYADLVQNIIDGDDEAIAELTEQLLEAGETPMAIIDQGLLVGMTEVGELFKEGEMFVPEVMMSAQAVTMTLDKLKAMIQEEDLPKTATVILGTVEGDLHDIGKNLVAMMLENSGFRVVDLGTDVAPADFCAAARDEQAQIVGMSALLTTTMPSMQATVEALAAEGMREQVKVVVGGAPVSDDYRQQIGADGYAEDAVRAVELCKNLLS